jgi:hypothetical protein
MLAIGIPQSNSSNTRARGSLPETERRGVFRTMLKVRVRRFHMDIIIKSIGGPRGYLKHLESDAAARENFAKFMKEYYPP